MAGKDDDIQDDTLQALQAGIEEMNEAARNDTGGLNAPLDEGRDDDDPIPGEKAAEMLDRQLDAGPEPEKQSGEEKPKAEAREKDAPKAEETDEDGETRPEDGETAPDDEAKSDTPDYAQADLDTLTKGVEKGRAAEIRRRLEVAQPLVDLYEAHKDDLARHGQTPDQAVRRLVEINQYAFRKPAEYLAWAAQQVAGDKMEEALANAAKLHGYKLVKDEPGGDEDDEFLDDKTKELRDENRRLREQLQGQRSIGPDAPEEQTVRQYQAWRNERDEQGRLKRPLFGHLEARIADRARQEMQQRGRPLDLGDIDRIYNELHEEVVRNLGVGTTAQATSAAPPAQAVQQPDQQRAAQQQRSTERARRASKSIDVPGQGAPRQPARDDDSDLAAIVDRYLG